MSLTSWESEFYPIDAEKLAKSEDVTEEQLIEHALKKWIGLREDNLKRHECYLKKSLNLREFRYIADISDPSHTQRLGFASCSLCKANIISCSTCPIKRATNATCDNEWHRMVTEGEGPEPMISLLQRTLEYVKTI